MERAFVAADGIRLHYLSEGNGQPAVFLHGGILDSHDFEAVLHLAAKQGYRAIAFDRPGYGRSERPKEKITPFDQARFIRKALQILDVQRPILVGHSWSGLLTLAYAHLYPNDVSGIVLAAPAMYKEGYPAEHGDPLSALMTAPVIGERIIRLFLKTPLAKAMTEKMLKQTFAPEPLPDGYRERVYSLWLRPGQIKANREDVLAFPPAALEAGKRYSEIQQPVSIIVGEDDPFGTREQALRLKRDIPHARLRIVPQVAHMIPQNHPELVIDALRMVDGVNNE
jgi:pimeloyl-ACP methyl ester carboxylesterase